MPERVRSASAAGGSPPVTFVYRLCEKPGFEQMVHDELSALIRKSRLEAGCLHFDLYRLADNRFCFFLHAVWENPDTLEAHSTSRHVSQFRAAVMRYLEIPIAMYELQEIT